MNSKWLFLTMASQNNYFFVRNLNMAIEASGILAANEKLQHLRKLLCGEALREFETLCLQIRSTTVTNFNQVVLVLGV